MPIIKQKYDVEFLSPLTPHMERLAIDPNRTVKDLYDMIHKRSGLPDFHIGTRQRGTFGEPILIHQDDVLEDVVGKDESASDLLLSD